MSFEGKIFEGREATLTPAVLADVFKEAKNAHTAEQQQKKSSATWAQWYAEYSHKKLTERMGDAVKGIFTPEKLEELLDDAENTHNATWPEYFSESILKELGVSKHEALKEKGLTLAYLSSLLRVAERGHKNYQRNLATEVPWEEWYAQYMSKKIQERFGEEVSRLLPEEVLKKQLAHAEEEHTREWPEYYGKFIMQQIADQKKRSRKDDFPHNSRAS